MMLRRASLVLGIALLVSAPALAQDRAQTLADIKAELVTLMAEFNALKTELIQTGAAANGAGGGDALQRMDAIEAELMRLTARTEEIEIKVNSVVRDGTNRIGDIEFRLCEVTEGCDVSTLPQIAVLGEPGAAPAPAAATDPAAATTPQAGGTTTTSDAPELAANEQAEFDRAKGVLGQGDFRTAADLFAAFAQSFPGSPLGPEAQILRGDALKQLGENADSARAYLDSYTAAPQGPRAPEALLKLGRGLADLGQVPEACATLAEVALRYPAALEVAEAQTSMQALNCP